jgi:hypothetical protein
MFDRRNDDDGVPQHGRRKTRPRAAGLREIRKPRSPADGRIATGSAPADRKA